MADAVEKLLSEYIAEHRAGGKADPLEYLGRADETDRQELALLIDGYLARSPGAEWNPGAFTGSAAERVADEVGRALHGTAGLWPAMLPRLRKRARLTRPQVVERLAATLGAGGREQKVAGYYHEMEQGTLDSRRVSERVLAALGEIYGTTAEKLREIGEPLGTGTSGSRCAGTGDDAKGEAGAGVRRRGPRAQSRAGGAGGGAGRDRRAVHGRPLSGAAPFVRDGVSPGRRPPTHRP